MQMTTKASRLEALQLLRAIAAGFVVYVHGLSSYANKVSEVGPGLLGIGYGELGVKLFFCISGYIIFSSSEALPQGGASVSYFLRRRFIRIAPMYWCATLIYAIKLSVQGIAPDVSAVFKSLLFFPFSDNAGLMRPVLGAGWTLNYEMFFYLVLGSALFAPRRWRLLGVTVVMVLLAWARYAGVLTASINVWLHALYLLSDTYLLFFVTGVLIGSVSESERFTSLPRLTWWGAVAAIFLFLTGLLWGYKSFSLSGEQQLALELAVCSACVIVCVKSSNSATTDSSTGIRRYAVLAGDGSFSTYLTHGFVMGPAARLLGIFHVENFGVVFALMMVLLCTFVGMVIFQHFENPLLKKMNAHWGRHHE
jgi:exopolysaccharide production protein ExoZ